MTPSAETLMVQEVNAEAIELSEGEKQKLALARALYKNAPVLILDEPSAALDPIAEAGLRGTRRHSITSR